MGLEYEPELATRAACNLAADDSVTIVQGDGWTYPLEPADAILVNAGTPRLSDVWLDALKPNGRLVVPLAVRTEHDGQPMTRGVIFLITRDADGYAAAGKSGTLIYPCWGGSDPDAVSVLAKALDGANAGKVTRLRREPVDDESRCWLRGPTWSLTFD